jgi:hypothetical protein
VVEDSFTGTRVNMTNGENVTNSMFAIKKSKGDLSLKDIYGYQKVKYADGSPVIVYDNKGVGSHVYKLINLYGDGQLASEYYENNIPSVLNNGTVKIANEITDEEIIAHYGGQTQPKVVPLQPMNKEVETQPVIDNSTLTDGDVVYDKNGTKFIFRGIREEGKVGARSPRLEETDGSKNIVIPGENVKLYTQSTKTQPVVREYTPENITSLKPNEVFVFGSNTEGRHGRGAAEIAVNKFGAKYGQAEGLQGQSYGIITKDLAKGKRSIPRSQLTDSFEKLYKFAAENPGLKFYVTKLGTDLAGYTVSEIQDNLIAAQLGVNIPDNIIFPKEFEFRDNRKVKTTQPSVSAYVTVEQLEADKSFLNTAIEFVDEISTNKDVPVAMRNLNKGEKIQMVKDLMQKKFDDKAWTSPVTQADGSKATALPAEQFKSFNEFLTFALLHEKAHETISKVSGETIGQYEDRINAAALNNMPKPPAEFEGDLEGADNPNPCGQ